jgi:pyruvate kinase
MMRRTKIVATVGPATAGESAIGQLVGAGVDVFRLNFSHGTRAGHAASVAAIRAAADRADRVVSIMQDLSGPKIRLGSLEGGRAVELEAGASLTIELGGFAGSAGRVSTASEELVRAVGAGDRLLVDDGRLELRVESADGTTIRATVVEGGPLGEHKGVTVPGVPLSLPTLTPKDHEDLAAGLAMGVDLVALSFVRQAADITEARRLVEAGGARPVAIVAKIERPEAVGDIDAIIDRADAVMIARGDLGLEMPLERVPGVQKEVTARARARGVPVILATQVLESMRSEPRPTRAEVSDAANAVEEGVDAIMLAGETAIGRFPLRAVQTLDAIIRAAERPPFERRPVMASTLFDARHGQALSEAAVTLAGSGQAHAIVAVTRGGHTARMLSALRPDAPILAVTPSVETARGLSLLWGVTPIVIDTGADGIDVPVIARALVGRHLAAGSAVVLVSVSPDLSRSDANFLRLQRLGEAPAG